MTTRRAVDPPRGAAELHPFRRGYAALAQLSHWTADWSKLRMSLGRTERQGPGWVEDATP
jgi:hypothetical protein